MTTPTRVYLVSDTRANPVAVRLVRASTQAQALRHVTRDSFAADVAGQNALIHWLGQGVQVEDASSELQSEAQP